MNELYSQYYNQEGVAKGVARGAHRSLIGGMWEEIGTLQIEFLKAQGLSPQSRLDIGCGSLRLGVRAVDYLEPGSLLGYRYQ